MDASDPVHRETMNYIENVVQFCQTMGYTLDEYDEMVGRLQETEDLLKQRTKRITRLLNQLEEFENLPVKEHKHHEVAKVYRELDDVLEAEVSRKY